MPYRALILLVCSANICRSPLAERLLARLIARAGDQERLRAASAGTWCVAGEPTSAETLQVGLERGLDLSAHRSRCLNQQDVDDADLILTMTQAHRQDIFLRFARAQHKTYLLSQMVGEMDDVADPYGGSLPEYRACRDRLEDWLHRGYEQIVSLALGKGMLAKRPGLKQRVGKWWRRLVAPAAKGPPTSR